jgi:hypothetical protein
MNTFKLDLNDCYPQYYHNTSSDCNYDNDDVDNNDEDSPFPRKTVSSIKKYSDFLLI